MVVIDGSDDSDDSDDSDYLDKIMSTLFMIDIQMIQQHDITW
jgi:hypothetical protein